MWFSCCFLYGEYLLKGRGKSLCYKTHTHRSVGILQPDIHLIRAFVEFQVFNGRFFV